MMHELKSKETSNRKLIAVSNYVTSHWILDADGNIDVKNEKGVLLENISINSALLRFYENVKPFYIISAYIWNLEEKKVERYIADLPDKEDKNRIRDRKISLIDEKIKSLQQQLENFL